MHEDPTTSVAEDGKVMAVNILSMPIDHNSIIAEERPTASSWSVRYSRLLLLGRQLIYKPMFCNVNINAVTVGNEKLFAVAGTTRIPGCPE